MIKRIKYEDLQKEALYLAQVFLVNPNDIFTEKEKQQAKENGYIDLEF